MLRNFWSYYRNRWALSHAYTLPFWLTSIVGYDSAEKTKPYYWIVAVLVWLAINFFIFLAGVFAWRGQERGNAHRM